MPETNRHMELRMALYQILKRELAARATIGSDQFVYYDPTTAKKKLAPDAFVKLDVPHKTFRIWKTWQRGAPDVAVEVVSDSDEGDEDWNVKLERYRAAGIAEVVRFDPDDDEYPGRVWDHVEGDLVEREPTEDGVFECAALGLFWVAKPHPAFEQILRLARDREGRDLLPTPDEAEQHERRARALAEQERKEEAHARALAEQAQQREAHARALAEQAQQQEAHARTLAEQGRAEAEQARDALAVELAELRRKLQEQSTGAAPADDAPPRRKAPRTARKR